MNNQRANFGLCQLDNFVYVFGGIQSKGKGKRSHVPNIVDVLAEKYDAANDKWEKIEIKGAPPLAAFSWTTLGPKNPGKIMILGGSDGDLLQDSIYIIDFKNLTAEEQSETIGNQTAMGTLVYRP